MPRKPTTPGSTPTRTATLKTWQPNGRIERTLKTRRVPFASPGGLIEAAAKLNPGWNVLRFTLISFDTNPLLNLEFGVDADGMSTKVTVELSGPEDAGAMAVYLMARTTISGLTVFACPNDTEGEELELPKVSPAELEAMQLASALTQ